MEMARVIKSLVRMNFIESNELNASRKQRLQLCATQWNRSSYFIYFLHRHETVLQPNCSCYSIVCLKEQQPEQMRNMHLKKIVWVRAMIVVSVGCVAACT